MKDQTNAVRDFHTKHGFYDGTRFDPPAEDVDKQEEESARQYLKLINDQLKLYSQEAYKAFMGETDSPMQNQNRDPRMLRMHLMMEELSELGEAMRERNDELAVDAIVDLMYVILGTAVTLWGDKAGDIVQEAFDEIQASNMTKAIADLEADPRLRDKGLDYVAPDTRKVLVKHGIIEA